MIAEFNHFDIKERIIDFFQNIFIVKKKLTDKRIIHYFEWVTKIFISTMFNPTNSLNIWSTSTTIFPNFVEQLSLIMVDSSVLLVDTKIMFVVTGC